MKRDYLKYMLFSIVMCAGVSLISCKENKHENNMPDNADTETLQTSGTKYPAADTIVNQTDTVTKMNREFRSAEQGL